MRLQIKRLCRFREIGKEDEAEYGYGYRNYAVNDERLLVLEALVDNLHCGSFLPIAIQPIQPRHPWFPELQP